MNKLKRNLLIVEDDADLIELLNLSFSDVVPKVYLATSGNEGLDLFCANRDSISVVICDIYMDNGDGMALIEDIKKISPEIPIIFFTGFSTKSHMINAFNQAAFDIIQKPDFEGLILSYLKAQEFSEKIQQGNEISPQLDIYCKLTRK